MENKFESWWHNPDGGNPMQPISEENFVAKKIELMKEIYNMYLKALMGEERNGDT